MVCSRLMCSTSGLVSAPHSADSRALAPGEVFVAYPGARADGRRFIAAAVARGASAVLWERQGQAGGTAIALPNVAVGEDDFVECGYCDRRFVLSDHSHAENEYLDPAARPPEAH